MRGRPPLGWALAPAAMALFPDRHGDLTVELIEAMRTALGDDGFARVLAERDKGQLASIEARLPRDADVATRVEGLAAVRAEQGYMAEVRADGDDDADVAAERRRVATGAAQGDIVQICNMTKVRKTSISSAAVSRRYTVSAHTRRTWPSTRCAWAFRWASASVCLA